MNRCVIVGAAPAADPGSVSALLQKDDWIIAADGGFALLQSLGIIPAVLVADFDSMPPQAAYPAVTEVVRLPVRKDQTDTLAAAAIAVERGYTDFLLLGGIGGRFDHTLANLQVLAWLAEQGCSATLADADTRVTLWTPGEYRLDPVAGFGFSLFAYDREVTGLSVSGASYNAGDITLTSSNPLGVSNDFLPGQAVNVRFHSGRLLAVLSRK